MAKTKKDKKSKTIKIQVYCHTGYSGCNHDYIEEIDREEWESLSSEEQDKWLDELAVNNMSNSIEYGAYVLED